MPGIKNYKFVRYVWTDDEGLEEKIIGPASVEEVEKDVANIKKLNNLQHHKYDTSMCYLLLILKEFLHEYHQKDL